MQNKALLVLGVSFAMVLSCSGQPPPEPQPPQPPPEPAAQPTAQPAAQPASAPAAAAEASPDQDPQAVDHKCHLCQILQADCGAAGRADCGALHADCLQKCQQVKSAAGSPKRGSPCAGHAECGSGLCCRMGKCGLNQMFYYPFAGESPGGQPGQVGVVLQCP